MLYSLAESASSWTYGYDLSKATGLKSGTLYPILTRLHDQGWLETKWTEPARPGRPPRHLYRLTALGLKEVKRLRAGVAKGRSQKAAYEN
jgi:PadR family transcriptional regulator, regulatory protein PadR